MGAGADHEGDPKTNLAVLERFYDAEMRYMAAGGVNKGADFSELAACLHPEAVFLHGLSSPFAGDWVGIDEIEMMFAVLADTYSSGEDLQVKYYVDDDGDEVAIGMRLLVTSRATGAKFELRLGQFVAFENGLIREFTTFYLDPLGARKACGI
jgi:ketosteroid isomerase-like protein